MRDVPSSEAGVPFSWEPFPNLGNDARQNWEHAIAPAKAPCMHSGACGSSKWITTGYDKPEHGAWPSEAPSVHFSSPTEAETMCRVIERYWLYRSALGTPHFVWSPEIASGLRVK